MQLFSMGLWQLHDNGTRVTDAAGRNVPTYDQADVVNFARGWTGFVSQLDRANIEQDTQVATNDLDPLRLYMRHRDMHPKTDLLGGHIGDGLPLCADLPGRAFLRRGATFEYVGPTPSARKNYVRNIVETPYVTRFEAHTNRSLLYEALCQRNTTGGPCQFSSVKTLDEDLACYGLECEVDEVTLVKLRGAGRRSNGEPYDVYYEYVREPCVELAYFDNPVLAGPRYGLRYVKRKQPELIPLHPLLVSVREVTRWHK